MTGIPLSGYDLHHAVLNWEVDKVVAILEERFVTELTSCTVDSDVGAKEYETITGAFMGSIMIWVKMPIALFKLAQFVKWKPILPADGDFFFINGDVIKQRLEDTGLNQF